MEYKLCREGDSLGVFVRQNDLGDMVFVPLMGLKGDREQKESMSFMVLSGIPTVNIEIPQEYKSK